VLGTPLLGIAIISNLCHLFLFIVILLPRLEHHHTRIVIKYVSTVEFA